VLWYGMVIISKQTGDTRHRRRHMYVIYPLMMQRYAWLYETAIFRIWHTCTARRCQTGPSLTP